MKKFLVIGSFFTAASLLAAPYSAQTSTNPVIPSNGTAITPNTTSSKSISQDMGQTVTTPGSKDRFTSTNDHKLGSQIRVQIAELIGAPKSNDITLIIDEGDVKLVGKAPSEDLKAKLAQSIQQIKGVKSVNNRLEINK